MMLIRKSNRMAQTTNTTNEFQCLPLFGQDSVVRPLYSWLYVRRKLHLPLNISQTSPPDRGT